MGSGNRLHEGVRLQHSQITLGISQILQHRTWLHPPPEETVQRPESHRKWHVWDEKRNQAGWSVIKLAFQHSSAESIGKRNPALVKEKRNGNFLEPQRSWLPSALVRNIRRAAPKKLCEFKRSTEKVGSISTWPKCFVLPLCHYLDFDVIYLNFFSDVRALVAENFRPSWMITSDTPTTLETISNTISLHMSILHNLEILPEACKYTVWYCFHVRHLHHPTCVILPSFAVLALAFPVLVFVLFFPIKGNCIQED